MCPNTRCDTNSRCSDPRRHAHTGRANTNTRCAYTHTWPDPNARCANINGPRDAPSRDPRARAIHDLCAGRLHV